ncbi:MAG: Na/Pi symporter [Pseudomonadales bacterium]
MAGTFLGGLGLFLLAVSMISDGLKIAAGGALRDLLARFTSTPLRGVLSGIAVTGIVQSSSAVTVATIGFVNAGLMTLAQSLGVVYGANIGTTMTGWLVAAVGFSVNLEALALPLIGVGMLARLLGAQRRFGAMGEALAGFGLFFIGVDVLREAFEGLAADVDVGGFAPAGILGVPLYVGVGFLMTLLTQSSSAAIAITLTAANGGVLGIEAAAAMVIGANVGTTSTAAFAVIGATANARRVAAAHVVFNVLTGSVALLLLPGLLWLVRVGGTWLGVAESPAPTLALFHTTFNVLGLLLMWPLTGRLASFLSARFTTEAEALALPRYLDRNVMSTPALAIDALSRELARCAELTRTVVRTAINVEGPPGRSVASQRSAALGLIENIESFITQLETSRMTQDVVASIPVALRVTNYLEEVNQLARELDEHRDDIDAVMRPAVYQNVADFQAAVVQQIDSADPAREDFDTADLQARYAVLQRTWHDLKTQLLNAAARHELPMAHLNSALDGLRGCLKMAEQLTKVAERLHTLAPAEDPADSPAPPAGDGMVRT